jgi:transcriptional regulator with XRE-family HTH domain
MNDRSKTLMAQIKAGVQHGKATQQQLAERVGELIGKEPHRNSVSQYLNGEMQPSLEVGLALIHAATEKGCLTWETVRLEYQRKGFKKSQLGNRR